MKKYLSFFRLKFTMGLQYRAAAIAGIMTQFFWAMMKILMFTAFYKEDPAAFPMTLQATITYIWLEQATLALFMGWLMENEIFESIMSGNVAYELCRPISVYNMWFARNLGFRYSRAILRCIPILTIGFLLPKPYGLILPHYLSVWILFIVSMLLSSLIIVALCMIIYIACFYTISSRGIRMIILGIFELLQGSIIPIPFFPDKIARTLEILPFGSVQNVPFRIFGGDISGMQALEAIALQGFWVIALVIVGKLLCARGMKKICVQGG